MTRDKKIKMMVALSGGMDSAVAAALLKKQGYKIAGVFMRLFDGHRRDEQAARRVAQKLEIHFKTVDLRRQFRKLVIDYFFREYNAGRTPNPCVVCNEKIKFGLLAQQAQKMGADFIATGHYAKIKKQNNLFRLFCAKDKKKDQSYFLYRLSQQQLGKIIFPLGDYTKDEVHQLAKKWRLPHKKEESVDVCFMAGQKLGDFLKKHLKFRPGGIVDLNGKILGQHQGLALYTIGQRAGVGGPGPFYVVGRDRQANRLIVSRDEKDLLRSRITVKSVNWLSGRAPGLPLVCRVKIRYRSETVPATIYNKLSMAGGRQSADIKFKKSQRAATPGQSVVFYRREELLGGGVIKY